MPAAAAVPSLRAIVRGRWAQQQQYHYCMLQSVPDLRLAALPACKLAALLAATALTVCLSIGLHPKHLLHMDVTMIWECVWCAGTKWNNLGADHDGNVRLRMWLLSIAQCAQACASALCHLCICASSISFVCSMPACLSAYALHTCFCAAAGRQQQYQYQQQRMQTSSVSFAAVQRSF